MRRAFMLGICGICLGMVGCDSINTANQEKQIVSRSPFKGATATVMLSFQDGSKAFFHNVAISTSGILYLKTPFEREYNSPTKVIVE